ncbi:competence protein ComG [Bacillus canaveralius]|uniref:Competence protein ComG n=1 Tax=Bacillus canaveralius TaxID=1403243 RepID=A0A2N5GR94_9BACI|nr:MULTISPECIES: competence type IV pilus minor pilin ComGD [Bacillus]PLR85967.1 competence protein ComG [Bacillus canaveralius]PLR87571.1 competence protein ComG [Bacillus sp. V33-4]PLS00086.1 competence protein ComG [Bacillus canaveralius]RSK53411.1 type II secretion system protein [Bacillus canaveralius]
MLRNESGFTLIESLFVLSIFLVVASVLVFTNKPHYVNTQKSIFFSELSGDLYFAQQYAIAHQEEVSVNFIPGDNYYYIRNREQIILKRDYPKGITVYEGTLKLRFQFQADGSIAKFGSFFVDIASNTYRVTFLIGKGRFYIEEE